MHHFYRQINRPNSKNSPIIPIHVIKYAIVFLTSIFCMSWIFSAAVQGNLNKWMQIYNSSFSPRVNYFIRDDFDIMRSALLQVLHQEKKKLKLPNLKCIAYYNITQRYRLLLTVALSAPFPSRTHTRTLTSKHASFHSTWFTRYSFYHLANNTFSSLGKNDSKTIWICSNNVK